TITHIRLLLICLPALAVITCVPYLFDPFFSLIPRPSPTSTLFPYTTLFRSNHYFLSPYLFPSQQQDIKHVGVCGSSANFPQKTLDRKSTRLNSSHGSISYAVFCLKKKKKKKQISKR